MLNWNDWNRTIFIKKDLALNNLPRNQTKMNDSWEIYFNLAYIKSKEIFISIFLFFILKEKVIFE